MDRPAPESAVSQPADATIGGRSFAEHNAQPSAPPEHILQFFAYEHLPAHLQPASAPFALLAESIVANTPRNPERTVALRKLLESKDAAVRAMLARPA